MGSSTRRTVLLLLFISVINFFVSMRWSTHQRQSLQSTNLDDEAKAILPTMVVERNRNVEGATRPNTNVNGCFPSYRRRSMESPISSNSTVVYLEIGFHDLHFETFYSFVDRLCSCSPNKAPIWTLKNGTTPQFFFGPPQWISAGARQILAEFNKSACGPLFVNKPPRDPDLTVVTTTYPQQYQRGDKRHEPLLNDPRYLLICHKKAQFFVENATNVYFLTPLYKKHIVPSYFPPSFANEQIVNTNKPVFLVIGSIGSNRRNLASLVLAMDYFEGEDFMVRFMGLYSSTELFNVLGGAFGRHRDKIQVVQNADAYTFMTNVTDAHVILPLVDNTNYVSQYQGGKKLTSSVSWGIGFHKKMILFDQLAAHFGLHQDNETYWTYNNPKESFVRAFGLCLMRLQLED